MTKKMFLVIHINMRLCLYIIVDADGNDIPSKSIEAVKVRGFWEMFIVDSTG